MVRDRLRCLLRLHTLTDYTAEPVVIERRRFGALIVRAAVGSCDVCGRRAVRYTKAIPRWQEKELHNRLKHLVLRWLGDYKEEKR